MKDKVDSSVIKLWNSFIKEHPEHKDKVMPDSWYFCDNKKDADECAELVVQGVKRATSTSLWWYETHQHSLPVIGDLYIITNWEGNAKAIIETTKVTPVKYKDITEEYAAIEGEGDKTLAYWKKVHWAYYTREMQEKGAQPSMDMTIVCEQFKTVWTQKQAGI